MLTIKSLPKEWLDGPEWSHSSLSWEHHYHGSIQSQPKPWQVLTAPVSANVKGAHCWELSPKQHVQLPCHHRLRPSENDRGELSFLFWSVKNTPRLQDLSEPKWIISAVPSAKSIPSSFHGERKSCFLGENCEAQMVRFLWENMAMGNDGSPEFHLWSSKFKFQYGFN